jgi:hypothetical protein
MGPFRIVSASSVQPGRGSDALECLERGLAVGRHGLAALHDVLRHGRVAAFGVLGDRQLRQRVRGDGDAVRVFDEANLVELATDLGVDDDGSGDVGLHDVPFLRLDEMREIALGFANFGVGSSYPVILFYIENRSLDHPRRGFL